jgi:hypothetical protein
MCVPLVDCRGVIGPQPCTPYCTLGPSLLLFFYDCPPLSYYTLDSLVSHLLRTGTLHSQWSYMKGWEGTEGSLKAVWVAYDSSEPEIECKARGTTIELVVYEGIQGSTRGSAKKHKWTI